MGKQLCTSGTAAVRLDTVHKSSALISRFSASYEAVELRLWFEYIYQTAAMIRPSHIANIIAESFL